MSTNTFVLDGKRFVFDKYEQGESIVIQGLNIAEAEMSEVYSLKGDSIDDIISDSNIQTYNEAAVYGAKALNAIYDNWTYDNNIMVGFNSCSSIWIVHGQAKNRYHSKDKVGVVIFKSETGEILFIDCVNPNT